MRLTKQWATALDDYVIDLAWSPDGAQLVAASSAGPLALLAAADGIRRELAGHAEGTNCLAFAPATVAPALLASGGQDGAVKLWDASAAQHLHTAKLGNAWVEQLAWRPTGGAILAAGAGRQLTLLRADGATAHALKPAPKTLAALAWHPQGGALASAFFGGVCLWDADDYLAQKEFAYANGIHALTFSPGDGRWLVSGNADPSVHLWLPEDDQEFHMSGYEAKVKGLSFDPTGRWLATTGGRDACVWDCAGTGPEGREPTMLPHNAMLTAVAFQHRGALLASAAQDGELQLWSPERPQPLRAQVKMPAAASRLAWSPDDRQLAVGSERGIVYVLQVEP
jgi:WD40 repeat protein